MGEDPVPPEAVGAHRDVWKPEGLCAGLGQEHDCGDGCRQVAEHNGYTWNHLPEG